MNGVCLHQNQYNLYQGCLFVIWTVSVFTRINIIYTKDTFLWYERCLSSLASKSRPGIWAAVGLATASTLSSGPIPGITAGSSIKATNQSEKLILFSHKREYKLIYFIWCVIAYMLCLKCWSISFIRTMKFKSSFKNWSVLLSGGLTLSNSV
jgi:hypothetical protein